MIFGVGQKDSDPEVKNLHGKRSDPVSVDVCHKEGKRTVQSDEIKVSSDKERFTPGSPMREDDKAGYKEPEPESQETKLCPQGYQGLSCLPLLWPPLPSPSPHPPWPPKLRHSTTFPFMHVMLSSN